MGTDDEVPPASGVPNNTGEDNLPEDTEPDEKQMKVMQKAKKTLRSNITRFETSINMSANPNPTVTIETINKWFDDLEYISQYLYDGKEHLYQKAIKRILEWFAKKATNQQTEEESEEGDDVYSDAGNNNGTGDDSTLLSHSNVTMTSSTNPFTPTKSAVTPTSTLSTTPKVAKTALPKPTFQSPQVQQPQVIPQPIQMAALTQLQHPFVYTKINTDLDPFDGSSLSYGHFIKLFELKYESNPYISSLDRFIKFTQLVGTHGKRFVRNLSPDEKGLAEAKRQMQQHFANPTTIKSEAKSQFENLNPVTSERNISQLRNNLETCESLINALIDCGVDINVINHSYFSVVASKFPFAIINSFKHGVEEVPKLLNHIRSKMERSAETAAQMGLNTSSRKQSRINIVATEPASNNSNVPNRRSQPTNRPQNGRRVTCTLCGEGHKAFFCKAHNARERKLIAVEKDLCLVCLMSNHTTDECRATYRCSCGGRHSSAICITNRASNGTPRIDMNPNAIHVKQFHQSTSRPQTGDQPNNESSSSSSTSSFNVLTSSETPKNVSLNQLASGKPRDSGTTFSQTALVRINNSIVRILLDTGADRTIVTPDMAMKLNLTDYGPADRTFVCAFSQKRKGTRRYIANVESLDGSHSMEMIFYGVPMPKQEKTSLSDEQHEQMKTLGYPISDVKASETEQYPIEITIGIDYYLKIWYDLPIPLDNGLFVQPSIFGWIMAGITNGLEATKQLQLKALTCSPFPKSYYMAMNSQEPSQLEQEFLSEFSSTKITYDNEQYTVSLPWLEPVRLGNNKAVAFKRFEYLLAQLERRGLMVEYAKEMNSLIENFAELAPVQCTPGRTNRMPHHPVVNRKKTTSQVRPVFDGGCKTGKQRSLNDNLFKGLNTWDALSLLLKFRFGTDALSADVEKAYLMIHISSEDRDALRFYWLNKDGKPTEYRFKVVPFGTSASPFLLYAVMKHHFNKFRSRYPDLIPIVENCFYVDDLLVSIPASSTLTIQSLHDNITELMQLAGMNIRKFRTNVQELDQLWAPDAKNTTSVLGHLWNVASDSLALCCDIDRFFISQTMTKRVYSSFMASIYDLTGLTMPFTVTMRSFLRKLWQLKLEWDEPLSCELTEEASALMTEARLVSDVSVPRNVIPNDGQGELLVYCDANHQVIGIAAYCLTSTSCNLIQAKAKLVSMGTAPNPEPQDDESPIASIPEKELTGLLMAAQCVSNLKKLYNFSSVTILSDSLVNLQRMDKHPNSMKPAVALKISQLKALTNAHFRHIESKLNIADLITKGSTMSQLLANSEWWNGPQIPKTTLYSVINVICDSPPDPCHQYSSYEKALRTYRMIAQWTKKRNITQYGDLSNEDLALIYLLKATQSNHFKEEIHQIQTKGKVTNRFSILFNYQCFLDEHGLLRLRTRLDKAINISYDQKYPIIMPGECSISESLIEFEHRRLNHVRVDRTLISVRDRYFIIHARRMANSILNKCYTCKFIRAKSSKPNYGSLPSFRMDNTAPPFANTGVDIFGPLKVSTITPGKRYGLIFSCATTRAIHLELLIDMTAMEVFQAMRRFFARRGIPQLFYSDNGTQFLTIRRKFKLFLSEIQTENPAMKIPLEWKLQTAFSPWRGGFYERMNRTIKDALTAVTFKKKVSDTELVTLLYEIESRVNSRPLFTLDGKVITPSHFFRTEPLTQMPSFGNNIARNVTRTDIIDHYIKSMRCQNAVWTAWFQQYLLQLKLFHSNPGKNSNDIKFKVGDVVLLKNNSNISEWPLGIITKILPSPDDVIRTVTVRTRNRSNNEEKDRAVQTLVLLECSHETVEKAEPNSPTP